MQSRPTVNVAELVIPAFAAMFQAVMNHDRKEYWCQGGRNSTKSSFISICIVLLIISFPKANAVVVRRFSNTLRDSVYNQVLWAITELGLLPWFKATTSPMEIVYKPTGQKIAFRGMDDPLKLKGIKFTVGYCAIHWFEELDQFAGWEGIQSALRSFKRGGTDFWTFYSYNPPRTMWSWVNRKSIEMKQKPTVFWSHSTYLDVISYHPEWVGGDTIDDAEYDKEHNPTHYRWEMLGEITGTGGSVFENIVSDDISQDKVWQFDNFRNGVDWGWFPDPWAFNRCHYDARLRELWVFGEDHANRMEPRETGQRIVDALTYSDGPDSKPRFHNQQIWCDDTADGKQQMSAYKRLYGLNARPAKKGNMRELSYRWLAGLRAIHIDPKRCPRTYEEFLLKEFERDRNGEWIDQIPDGNDHHIDAIRYAVMNDVRRNL